MRGENYLATQPDLRTYKVTIINSTKLCSNLIQIGLFDNNLYPKCFNHFALNCESSFVKMGNIKITHSKFFLH